MRPIPAIVAAALALVATATAARALEPPIRFVCVPETLTRCSAPGACESRPPTESEKAELLVLDFTNRRVAVRAGGKDEAYATIVDLREEGGKRLFGIKPNQGSEITRAALAADGRMEGSIGDGSRRFVARCAPTS